MISENPRWLKFVLLQDDVQRCCVSDLRLEKEDVIITRFLFIVACISSWNVKIDVKQPLFDSLDEISICLHIQSQLKPHKFTKHRQENNIVEIIDLINIQLVLLHLAHLFLRTTIHRKRQILQIFYINDFHFFDHLFIFVLPCYL